jgi:hypothetical protein
MDEQWKTIAAVNSCVIFDKVKLGDDVAILQCGEVDWWTGIVTDMKTYSGRSTRFQERPYIVVRLHAGPVRAFYEHNVAEILFK